MFTLAPARNLIHKFDGVGVAPYILFRELFCLAGPRTVQDHVYVQKGGGVFKYLIDLVLSVRIIPGMPFHDALVAANPQNLVWGTDWPHPRPNGPVPDAARLLKVFLDWTKPKNQQAILVSNPARLYDFPGA